MDTKMSKEDVLKAWKKALEHKKEARVQFEKWLQERGIEGKVVPADARLHRANKFVSAATHLPAALAGLSLQKRENL